MKKRFFTKGSTNRWIWHLYNAIRSAKPIQIQPIIPNLINQRKIAKQIRIWLLVALRCTHTVLHTYLPTVVATASKARIYKKIRENSNHIRICFSMFHGFIKFGIMGWICIDFALLNTFANCDFYRFLSFWLFLE